MPNADVQHARRRVAVEVHATYAGDALRGYVQSVERSWSLANAETMRDNYVREMATCVRRREFPYDSKDDYFYYAAARWAMAQVAQANLEGLC